MPKNRDWLKGKTLPEQDTMFVNVEAKIDNYKTAYGLGAAWIDEVKLICGTFHAAFTGVMQSRASGKKRDTWFKELLETSQKKADAPTPPVFGQIALPDGAKGGLYERFREMMEFFKSNDAYSKADGDDLMITAPEGVERDASEAFPEFKFSEDASGNVAACSSDTPSGTRMS